MEGNRLLKLVHAKHFYLAKTFSMCFIIYHRQNYSMNMKSIGIRIGDTNNVFTWYRINAIIPIPHPYKSVYKSH